MRPEEFATLSNLVRERVVETAIRITGNSDDSEDIAQDTLLKMWELRDRIGEFRSPLAMALAIARNKSIDFIRHSRSDVEFNSETMDTPDLSPHEKFILDEQVAELDRIMSQLPSSQQTILKLRHIEEYSIREIATMFATTEGNVRTMLSRARNNVKKQFLLRHN